MEDEIRHRARSALRARPEGLKVWRTDVRRTVDPTATAGGGPNEPDEPNGPEHEGGEEVDLEEKPVSAVPRRYKVIFHNDDYTTMEFVVEVLKRFFHKSDAEAVHVMLTVHKTGAAVAGVYTRDVAETKAQEVMTYARDNGMPLLLTTEPE